MLSRDVCFGAEGFDEAQRENRTLRLTWRELETWPWLSDCGPLRKRWKYHRHLQCARLLPTLPARGSGRNSRAYSPTITSDLPYRPAQSLRAARAEIERCSGRQFDPEIVKVFLEMPDKIWETCGVKSKRKGDRLDKAISALTGLEGTGRNSTGKRTMSAAARERIAQAQRERWKKFKAAKKR